MNTEPNLANFWNVDLSGMLPYFRYIWVKALRSGDYKQGRSQLFIKDWMDDSYCCLGVLCDITAVGEWRSYGTEDEEEYGRTYCVHDSPLLAGYDLKNSSPILYESEERLPALLRAFFDIPEDTEERLMQLNDGDEHTERLNFNDIADIIEDSLIADGYSIKELEAKYGN
jgi:hypothetical protein